MGIIDYKDYLIREKNAALEDQNAFFDIQFEWEKLEKKYGVSFFLKDGTPRPVDEWLDDCYLKLTITQIHELMTDILLKGDILFSYILKHKQ